MSNLGRQIYGSWMEFAPILAVNMDKGHAPEHLRNEASEDSKVGVETIVSIHRALIV